MAKSLKKVSQDDQIFKCPDCKCRYKKDNLLYDHVEEDHKDLIPDGITIKQYVFNRKRKRKEFNGKCMIDRRPTMWNEKLNRYEKICSARCRTIARERFKANALNALGTDNPAADPEHQKKAMMGRAQYGEYKFADGGKVGYFYSFELDFLEFMDQEMNFRSVDVQQAQMTFDYDLDGKVVHHIPDFYIPVYNLVIQIKASDKGAGKKSFIRGDYKRRQYAADNAIIQAGTHNYIKIVDKDYEHFVEMINYFRGSAIDQLDDNDVIYHVPKL